SSPSRCSQTSPSQLASRPIVCPTARASWRTISSSTSSVPSRSLISTSAATSPSVNATSSSGGVGKPRACQVLRAYASGTPERASTSSEEHTSELQSLENLVCLPL